MEKDSISEVDNISSATQYLDESHYVQVADEELDTLIKTLKNENETLRDDISAQATLYDEKINKFECAILERDNMINQLKNNLENCIIQQNKLKREVESQAEEFNKEIEKLREALLGRQNKSLGNFGENYRELQMKLIEVQEERAAIINQSKLKADEQVQTEQKYKLLLKKQLAAQDLHLKEIKDYEDQIEIIKNQVIEKEVLLSEEHNKQIQNLEEKFINKEHDIQQVTNILSGQIEQLHSEAQNRESRFEAEIQELLVKIKNLNEQLAVTNQKEEVAKKDWEIKYDNMVKELHMQHEKDIANIKLTHQREMSLISEQIDFLENNHQEDQLNFMETLKGMVDTKACIQQELEKEKNMHIETCSKLNEAQKLLASLQELNKTLEMSNNEAVVQQQEKNYLLKQEIKELEAELLKSKELHTESEAIIMSLNAELIYEKGLKNELNSLLQEANSGINTYSKEIASLNTIKNSLENENKILNNKIEETKNEMNKLNQEIADLQNVVKTKSFLEECVNELQQNINENKSLLCEYKEYKNECHLLKSKIQKWYNIIKNVLRPEDMDKCIESNSSHHEDDFYIFESFINVLIAKCTNSDMSQKQSLSFTKEIENIHGCKRDDAECADMDQLCFLTACSSEATDLNLHENERMDKSIVIEDSKKKQVKKVCVSCQTILPATSDRGFQTCIPEGSSSLIATKTIEEDYLMEEILIFPRQIEKRDSYKEIKDSTNLNEWKKKFFDVKFINKSLQNENLVLKKSLHDLNIICGATEVANKNNHTPLQPEVPNVHNSKISEQENIAFIKSHLEVLEDKFKKKEVDLQNFGIYKNDLKNSDIFIAEGIPNVDSGNVNNKNLLLEELRKSLLNETREKLNLLMSFKSLNESVLMLKKENNDLQKWICKELPNKQDIKNSFIESSLSFSEQMDALASQSYKLKVEILQAELRIQILCTEILKDKESTSDFSNEQSQAREGIMRGIRILLEETSKSSEINKKIVDNVISEWLRAVQVSSVMHGKKEASESADASSKPAELLPLLSSIEEHLKGVLSEQQESRKVLKEVENNLISTLENNFHLLRSNYVDTTPQVLDTLGTGSKCQLRISRHFSPIEPPFDFHEDDEGSDENEESKRMNAITNSAEQAYGQVLKEFEDITGAFVSQSQSEKVNILETQRNLLVKILQDNQNKIAEICQNHLEKLKNSRTEDLEKVVDTLVEDVKTSLVEETANIETEYGEFLKQYFHEQSLHSQMHSLAFMELKERIASALQNNICQEEHKVHCENEKVSEIFSGDLSNGKFVEKVATMSSFTDLESQKGILNILTQITLNLLHYYSISQNNAAGTINVDGDQFADQNALNISFDVSNYGFGSGSPPCNKYSTVASEVLPEEQYRSLEHDDGISQNPLDITAASEGMLEDVEKDEQIKKVLSSSCPNLTSILKGKFDAISMVELEKEVQEFLISLQASAGMLKIIMAREADPHDNSLTLESGYVPDLSQHPNSCLSDLGLLSLCREKLSYQDCLQSLSYDSIDPNDHIDKSFGGNQKLGQIENFLESVLQSGVPYAELKTLDEHERGSPEEVTLDYTTLKHKKVAEENQIQLMSEKLKELLDQRNVLKKQLHQAHGHLIGVLEEKKLVEQENCHLENDRIKLSKDLQQMKDLLENSERKNKALLQSQSVSPNKKLSPREIKDKVKAILAAKDIETLEQRDLVARVKDLESVLEDVIRSKDEIVESLNLKLSDLTQQLEVADRQLKQSRQFLDEQAAERDQEFEVLLKDNEKLNSILKEKESLANQHQSLLKEVSGFEKELLDKIKKLEAAKQEREQIETDLNRALDKVKDLRDIVQSLESQLNSKCLENQQLTEKIQCLNDGLREEKRLCRDANMQLESMEQDRRPSRQSSFENNNDAFGDSSMGIGNRVHGSHKQVTKSLSEELDVSTMVEQCPESTQEIVMLQHFADMLERSTNMLESLQVTNISGSAVSDEEVSVREQLELSRNASQDESRSLSPSSLEHKLSERFASFERTAEAAVKHSRDLEMRLKIMKTDYEEVLSERDELLQKLTSFSNLKTELEKAVREYDELKVDFDLNVSKLKQEIFDMQEKVTVEQFKKIELEVENRTLTKNVEALEHIKSSDSSEIAKLEENVSALETKLKEFGSIISEMEIEKKALENKILELCTERDCLQKQYSEQLIKLSSTESRLEDIRRADSPQDFELKIRINSLQDELIRCREELTLKYRETEDLQYTLKDLKEKLILRDEELERIHQESYNQPSSLPQTTVDQRLIQIQDLKNEIKLLKEDIEELNEQKYKDGHKLNLSDSLLKHILNQKNAEIDHLKTEFDSLKPIAEVIMPLIQDGNTYQDIFKAVEKCLEDDILSSQVDTSPEIQRKQVEKSSGSILAPPDWDLKINSSTFDEASYVSSNQPSNSSKLSLESIRNHSNDVYPNAVTEIVCSTGEGSLINDLTLSDFLDDIICSEDSRLSKVIDENSLLKEHINILEKESIALTEYQKKLEEDFKSAQEMIERKDEEISMLNNEMEDSSPCQYLTSEIHAYQEKMDAEMLKNEALENELHHCQEQMECMKSEINSLQETIEYLKSKEMGPSENDSKVNRLEEEIKTLKQAEDTLTRELNDGRKSERNGVDKIKMLEESIEKLKLQENNLRKEVDLFEKELTEKLNLLSQQKSELLKRDQDVEELNVQMGQLITQLKDNSTTNEKRLHQAHQMHNSIIHEMNEKNIEREKQLCNEYEERMASQITDLSLKLSHEKNVSLKQVREHFESLLTKAMLEKENIMEELQKLSQEKKLIDKTDSVEDLRLKLRQELSNSAQLDNSLFLYLEGDANDQSRKNTSHESSIVSETSNNNNENASVTHKIQMLMKKVLKEGEQVLTQTERLFLEYHVNPVLPSHLNCRTSSESPTVSQDVTLDTQTNDDHQTNAQQADMDDNYRPYLLKRISSLQQEMIQREKESNKKIRLLEYCSEQEKCYAEEWHEQLEVEKLESKQLRKQLTAEKSRTFDLTSELTQVKCQLQLLQNQLQNLQMERDTLTSQVESIEQQNQELDEALLAERNNFSRVSMTLNHQRKLATSTAEHQNKIILELRDTVETERKRVLNLVSQLHIAKLNSEIPSLHNTTLMTTFNGNSSRFIEKELEGAFSKDREMEVKLKLEETELALRTLKEEQNAEKAEHISQLGEEQIKVSQLQKRVAFYETEKEALMKNLHQKFEETRLLKEQLSRLQKENNLLKSELRLLSESRHKENKKLIHENDDVQVKYSSALDNLQKKDSELVELKRKLAKSEYELMLYKEREIQLTRDLKTEKEAASRLGLPTINRIQNLNEYLELQQNENFELCQSLSRVNDERRTLKQRIGSLETLVLELNEQVASHKSNSMEDNLNRRSVHAAERAAFEAEKSSLQLALRQLEAKNASLCNALEDVESKLDRNKRTQNFEMGLQYVLWKYNRSESYRKALIWQKNYIFTLLDGFQKTESHTLQRLTAIAHNANHQTNDTKEESLLSPSRKFRSAVLVVISIHRMKFLVKRWQLNKRMKVFGHNYFTFTDTDSVRGSLLNVSKQEDLGSRQPQAANVAANLQERKETNRVHSPVWQVTGQTPPTKEGPKKAVNKLGCGPQKNLFDAGSPSDFDDYITRIEHIHASFGIPSSKS